METWQVVLVVYYAISLALCIWSIRRNPPNADLHNDPGFWLIVIAFAWLVAPLAAYELVWPFKSKS